MADFDRVESRPSNNDFARILFTSKDELIANIFSDNRIAAFASDTSTYVFTAPEAGAATVRVDLLFRRAFKELMDQKGWEVPDIMMEQEIIRIP